MILDLLGLVGGGMAWWGCPTGYRGNIMILSSSCMYGIGTVNNAGILHCTERVS